MPNEYFIPEWLFVDMEETKKIQLVAEKQQEILKKVRNLRKLGYTYEIIGAQLNVSSRTASKWHRGKTLPSLAAVKYYETFSPEVELREQILVEVSAIEKKHAKKKRKRKVPKGTYITPRQLPDDKLQFQREVHRFQIHKFFDDYQSLLSFMEDKISTYLPFFNEKKYGLYYVGCQGYYRHDNGKTNYFGIQSPLTIGDINVAKDNWQGKMESLINAPYVIYWYVSDVWISGSEYTDILEEARSD